MQPVYLWSDLDTLDARLLDAVRTISGLDKILVCEPAWKGELDTREADLYLEWQRTNGRFGLALHLYSPNPLCEPMTEAEFVRRLAAELARPILISDCAANPWSYFRIDPDGALFDVYVETDDADGNESFNLACDFNRDHAQYLPERQIWPSGAAYPHKPDDAPDHMPNALRRWCDDAPTDARLCEAFWAPCPKSGLRR